LRWVWWWLRINYRATAVALAVVLGLVWIASLVPVRPNPVVTVEQVQGEIISYSTSPINTMFGIGRESRYRYAVTLVASGAVGWIDDRIVSPRLVGSIQTIDKRTHASGRASYRFTRTISSSD
jgi:hypothetical protein